MKGKLRSEVSAVLDQIPVDFGGGCSGSKAYLLAWLVRRFRMKNTLDIGVYRGRSLFPQAIAHRQYSKGKVYGVDPWDAASAREQDNVELRLQIDEWADRTDFEELYRAVLAMRERLRCEDHCTVIRAMSARAAASFEAESVTFDLIHVDGNHDARVVEEDVRRYVPLLRTGGFFVMDDISWASVRGAYETVGARMPCVFERVDDANDYAVFWNGRSALKVAALRVALKRVGAN
jgi:predicted O-methyltransferase YrrM